MREGIRGRGPTGIPRLYSLGDVRPLGPLRLPPPVGSPGRLRGPARSLSGGHHHRRYPRRQRWIRSHTSCRPGREARGERAAPEAGEHENLGDHAHLQQPHHGRNRDRLQGRARGSAGAAAVGLARQQHHHPVHSAAPGPGQPDLARRARSARHRQPERRLARGSALLPEPSRQGSPGTAAYGGHGPGPAERSIQRHTGDGPPASGVRSAADHAADAAPDLRRRRRGCPTAQRRPAGDRRGRGRHSVPRPVYRRLAVRDQRGDTDRAGGGDRLLAVRGQQVPR